VDGAVGRPAFYRQIAQMDQRYTDEIQTRIAISAARACSYGVSDDQWIPIDKGRELARLIPGCELIGVTDCGHLMQEDAPEAIVAAALRFFPLTQPREIRAMPQHFVCLTFDLDNTSGMIARGLTTPTMISRGDFGMVATERLLALLQRTTSPRPGLSRDTRSRPIQRPARGRRGRPEIGHHGWTHRVPAQPQPEEEERELVRGNEAILKLTGRAARGYRSPAWD
jgi:hypothetical protein